MPFLPAAEARSGAKADPGLAATGEAGEGFGYFAQLSADGLQLGLAHEDQAV